MTTLTDAEAYSADKIRALYGQRRSAELHILPNEDPARFGHPPMQEPEDDREGGAHSLDRLKFDPAIHAASRRQAGRRTRENQLRRAKNYHLLTKPRQKMRVSSHRDRPRFNTPS